MTDFLAKMGDGGRRSRFELHKSCGALISGSIAERGGKVSGWLEMM